MTFRIRYRIYPLHWALLLLWRITYFYPKKWEKLIDLLIFHFHLSLALKFSSFFIGVYTNFKLFSGCFPRVLLYTPKLHVLSKRRCWGPHHVSFLNKLVIQLVGHWLKQKCWKMSVFIEGFVLVLFIYILYLLWLNTFNALRGKEAEEIHKYDYLGVYLWWR